VPWLTAALLAVVVAYADGFWMVALRETIGAIERAQEPFRSWLVDSAWLVPVYLLVLVVVFRRAADRAWRPVVVLLLVAIACTVLGMTVVAVRTANDYQLQSRQLTVLHAVHGTPAVAAGHGHVPSSGCDTLCRDRAEMVAVDLRAMPLALAGLGGTNLIVVGWVVALLGGGRALPGGRPAR
jgi:hypothetical protein